MDPIFKKIDDNENYMMYRVINERGEDMTQSFVKHLCHIIDWDGEEHKIDLLYHMLRVFSKKTYDYRKKHKYNMGIAP